MNTAPHTSHFLIDLHALAWLKSCVCRAHITCRVSSSCTRVFVLTLRLLHFPLSAYRLLSYHPVLPPAHQLHLPRCGGQIPCALSLMRTLAPCRVRPSHRICLPLLRQVPPPHRVRLHLKVWGCR